MVSKDVKKVSKKIKPVPAANEAEDAQPANEGLLAAYGEHFMSMFDDYDEQQERQQKQKQREEEKRAKQQKLDQEQAAKAAAQAAAGNRKAGKGKQQEAQAGAGPQASAEQNGTSNGKRKREVDEIEEIIFNQGKKAIKNGSQSPGAGLHAGASAPRTPLVDLKRERKLFMSSKAGKVHEAVHTPASSRPAAADAAEDDDTMLSPEEFKKLQLEVERLGASALDKRDRKKWQAAMLTCIGAQADRTPRTAARIGKGMAKKSAQRDAKALEEAIETGMVKRAGLGKKKRALKSKNYDRGLQEAGPGFKNGVLRIKGLDKKIGKMPVRGGGKGGKGGKKRKMKLPF